MVRSYLRHEPILAFSLISSPSATAQVHLDPRDSRTAYTPALEDILVWDTKHGSQLASWHETSHRASVTALTRSPSLNHFAVGYADGSIRLWDVRSNTAIITFNGHKSAVTTLAFDHQGLILASGSQDTDLILWDIVAESGLYRLRGHRDAITQVLFVPELPVSTLEDAGPSSLRSSRDTARYLLSTSKDGFLKLWDLSLQHCVETAIPGKGEIWSMATALFRSTPQTTSKKDDGEGSASIVVLTGGTDGQTRVYELDIDVLRLGLEQASKEKNKDDDQTPTRFFHDRGSLTLSAKNRVAQIEFSPLPSAARRSADEEEEGAEATIHEPHYLAISSSDRSVQIFRIRTPEEIQKKLIRRKRRIKEKGKKGGKKRRAEDDEDQDDEDGDGDGDADGTTWVDRVESHTIVRPSPTSGGKLRSFSLALAATSSSASSSARALLSSKPALNVLLGLNTNALETWTVPAPALSKSERAAVLLKDAAAAAVGAGTAAIEPTLSTSLDLPGHRSDVRALALSPDNTLLASADSSGILKIWNVKSGRCIRTFTGVGYALCLIWLEGGRHLVLGCKDGSLRTFDVPAALMVQHLAGGGEKTKGGEEEGGSTAAGAGAGGKAHDGAVWSLALHPNGLSCVSASADKTVKFWEFEMHSIAELQRQVGGGGEKKVSSSSNGDEGGTDLPTPVVTQQQQQLVLVHTRTLRMTDDILSIKFSPNGKLLALSLLDATVKIFFADTLKFFLSLYGHKLPVLALDISSDSKLVITVSADKNVKIWGLDYGDCHRSLYAHEESIMACGFERGEQGGGLMGGREGASHHFWTAGKDGLLKHWDGDRFELIQTLEGHHGEIWALAVDSRGTLCVTAGADRSIRTWEKTDEPLFLEEEREKEMEKMYEAAGVARAVDEGKAIGSLAPGADGGGGEEMVGPEAAGVQKSTTETLMAGERLMEALDIADEDRRNEHLASNGGFGLAGRPPRHPLLLAAFGLGVGASHGGGLESGADADGEPSGEGYVLKVVQKILPAQLEDALLVLPFDKVISLMQYLDIWAKKDWNISLTSRILFFLLRTHHAQIVSNKVMRTTLINLRIHLQTALGRQRDTMGFNLAALRHSRGVWVSERTAEMYESGSGGGIGLDMDEDAVREKIESGGRRKRKVAIV
ncbi:hypothetical protein CF319_g5839 [Tilletia indica]|nr:hypothetical protein CF319_g5839 [Tilletia indica]